MSSKLFVGNLSFDAVDTDIRELFSQYGQVTDLHLPTDRETGRPRGFAFVTLDSAEAARAAEKALNGQQWQGRALAVNEARPQTDRPAYSGGGGGGGGGYGDKRGGGGGGGRGGYGDKRGGGGGGRY